MHKKLLIYLFRAYVFRGVWNSWKSGFLYLPFQPGKMDIK